jgi:membrane protease YdiL (CAAX protease family)
LQRDRFSPIEFAIVIGLAFGRFILDSVTALLAGTPLADAGAFGDEHLYYVVLYEVSVTPVVAAVLYYGGWRPRDFRIGPSFAGTAGGFGIVVGVWVVYAVLWIGLQALFPSNRPGLDAATPYLPAEAPSAVAVLLLVLVNPAFEEILVTGYVIEALRRRFGDTAAANASVVIRVCYHLYQGIATLPYHCAFGLVQAYVYLRFGKLWPLIVAHAILDFIALSAFLR